MTGSVSGVSEKTQIYRPIFWVSTVLLIVTASWCLNFFQQTSAFISNVSISVFTVILALAAAGFATAITGLMEVQSKFVKATGPMAAFVLVFFVFPQFIDRYAKLDKTSEDSISGIPAHADYQMLETFYLVDLRTRVADAGNDTTQPFSPVIVERRDVVRKLRATNEPLIIPFGTNGLKLDFSRKSGTDARFEEAAAAKPGEAANPWKSQTKLAYDYVLPIETKAIGYQETIVNKFTFWNAFQNETEEWFGTITKYPTNHLSVVLLFPKEKPCRSVTVDRYDVLVNNPKRQDADPPRITDDGQTVYWSTSDLKGGHRYTFNWKW